MKNILRSTLIITLVVMIFSTSVFAAREMSLIGGTDDLMNDYGNGFKITPEDKEIIEAIKKTGKTDFKEGIYGSFRPWGESGPGSSSHHVSVDNLEGFNKLVFEVTAITEDKFNDLEAYMNWMKFYEDGDMEFFDDTYNNYDEYKKDYKFSEKTNENFYQEKLTDINERSVYGKVQVIIKDWDWENFHVTTASDQWETVEVDISNYDKLNMELSISGTSGGIIANPRLVGDDNGKPITKDIELKVVASSSIVNINGQIIDFDAYNIDNNNYFKLRDLAKALNGTEKQFEVGWDPTNKSINLISGQAYTTVGGELSKDNIKKDKAIESKSSIYKDGQEVQLKAYTIGNNNYFKLRDIGRSFDFGVNWDNLTKTIKIDTSIGYTEE